VDIRRGRRGVLPREGHTPVIESWRSALFVPGDDLRKVSSAARSQTDAIILDLEDGVAPLRKKDARSALREGASKLDAAGFDVVVRINAPWEAALTDLQAAVMPNVRAIMVPKSEAAPRLQVLGEMIEQLERSRGLTVGGIALLALVESPTGLGKLDELASAPRVCGLALGTEDFSLSLGVPPTPECLDLPSRMVCLAARSRGLMALAVPASIAAFRAIDAFGAAARQARRFGATGALCVHPAQAVEANRAFQPTEAEAAQARSIIDAWRTAQERGDAVTSLNDQMIDAPVAARAFRLLASLQPEATGR
jgi:citrate lyase subunit beta/citryl-CoA lyase